MKISFFFHKNNVNNTKGDKSEPWNDEDTPEKINEKNSILAAKRNSNNLTANKKNNNNHHQQANNKTNKKRNNNHHNKKQKSHIDNKDKENDDMIQLRKKMRMISVQVLRT